MMAEFGLAALWLAAALAALQLLAGSLSLKAGEESGQLAALVRPSAIVQGVLTGLSFAALLVLFVNTDLSVKLVAMNSHSARPSGIPVGVTVMLESGRDAACCVNARRLFVSVELNRPSVVAAGLIVCPAASVTRSDVP